MLKFLVARLSEASTYAGFAAFFTAIATAFQAEGAARYSAVGAAVVSSLAAIAKAEGVKAAS